MELIFEFVIEIIAEMFDWQLQKSKRNKWIYYPLLILNIILFLLVSIGLIVLGVVLFEDNMIISIILIGLGVSFIVGWLYKNIVKRKKR